MCDVWVFVMKQHTGNNNMMIQKIVQVEPQIIRKFILKCGDYPTRKQEQEWANPVKLLVRERRCNMSNKQYKYCRSQSAFKKNL